MASAFILSPSYKCSIHSTKTTKAYSVAETATDTYLVVSTPSIFKYYKPCFYVSEHFKQPSILTVSILFPKCL